MIKDKLHKIPQQLEKFQDDVWYWNKKPIKLKDLHFSQLSSIKRTLNNYYPSIRYINNKVNIVSRMYYGKTSDYWLKAIKHIEKHNDFSSFKEAINIIKGNKLVRAEKDASEILDIITIKTMKNV